MNENNKSNQKNFSHNKKKRKKNVEQIEKYHVNGAKVMKRLTTTQPLGKLKEYFFPNPKIISN